MQNKMDKFLFVTYWKLQFKFVFRKTKNKKSNKILKLDLNPENVFIRCNKRVIFKWIINFIWSTQSKLKSPTLGNETWKDTYFKFWPWIMVQKYFLRSQNQSTSTTRLNLLQRISCSRRFKNHVFRNRIVFKSVKYVCYLAADLLMKKYVNYIHRQTIPIHVNNFILIDLHFFWLR